MVRLFRDHGRLSRGIRGDVPPHTATRERARTTRNARRIHYSVGVMSEGALSQTSQRLSASAPPSDRDPDTTFYIARGMGIHLALS